MTMVMMMMIMAMMIMMMTRMVDDMRTEEMSIRTMFGVILTLCHDLPYAVLWLWHMLGYGWCDSHLLWCHANHHPTTAIHLPNNPYFNS